MKDFLFQRTSYKYQYAMIKNSQIQKKFRQRILMLGKLRQMQRTELATELKFKISGKKPNNQTPMSSGFVYPSLSIVNNKRSLILMDIQHIKFNSLQKLFLAGNKIESIEVLVRIQIPNLQIITLSQNNILSIDCLRKATFLSLASFDIFQNKINHGNCLTQMKTSKFIRDFVLEINHSSPSTIPDISWLLKLQAQSIIRICKNLVSQGPKVTKGFRKVNGFLRRNTLI